jgi:hypothetical protein
MGWPDSKRVTHVDGEESRAIRPRQVAISSDLTDSEWELAESLIRPGKRGGGKRTEVMRDVVNGSFAMPIPGTETSSFPQSEYLGSEYLGLLY